jgi:formylglycine-generating enzyme required for sulfatase activity
MGSSLAEVERCVAAWTDRLIDPLWRPRYRNWILKEFPAHPVQIAPFIAQVFPVRNADWRAFWTETGGHLPESATSGAPVDHPVWGVARHEAEAYAAWLRSRSSLAWRLPTESEWEWMAAGPEGRRHPFGDDFDHRLCNTLESDRGTTTPVDAFAHVPAWCGACDLAGNAEEWTASTYAPYPGGDVVRDELYDLLGPGYPIIRGGSFALGGDLTRSARRHGPHPAPRFRFVGFRLVASLSADAPP